MKEQDKFPEKNINEVEISNLIKEFKIMIIKILNKLKNR